MGWGDWSDVPPLSSCTGSDTQPNAILSMEATLFERYDETRYIEVYWNTGSCLGYNEDPDYIVTSTDVFEVIPADYYIIEVTLNVGCWFVFKLIVPGYDSDSASCSCMID